MVHVMRNRVVVMGLVGCLSMVNPLQAAVSVLGYEVRNPFSTALPPYSAPGIIGQKHSQIRNVFVNCSSHEVSKRGNKEKSLSAGFKKFLKTEFMQKVKDIYHKQGGSGTALGTIQLKEGVAQDLENKESSLISERDTCQMKQIMCGVGAVGAAGVGLIITGQFSRGNERQFRRPANTPELAAGLMSGLISGAFVLGAVYLSYKKGWINDHIPQVQTMRKDWQSFYDPSA